jgi:hypothetical protein
MNHWALLPEVLNSYIPTASGKKDVIEYKFVYPAIQKEAI